MCISTYGSPADQIVYIRQIQKKKWEYNGTLNQLFVDFKYAYDQVKTSSAQNSH